MDKGFSPNLISSASVFSTDNPYYIHRSVVRESLGLHRHDFFEIDIVISGNAVSYINGENYTLLRGDVVLLTPSDHHNYIVEENEKIECFNIAFPMGLISPQAMSAIPSDVKVLHLSERDYRKAASVCDFLIEKYDDTEAECTILMKASIEWLFAFLSFFVRKDKANPEDISKFSQALLYINDHFSDEELNRSTVASIMHISPTHFSKMFHKMVGLSFQEYLLNTRLNYASGMLKMTDMTVAEIACASGFGSDSYFSKVFKKRFGVSPGRVRQMQEL